MDTSSQREPFAREVVLVTLALAASAIITIAATDTSLLAHRLELTAGGSSFLRIAGAALAAAGMICLFLLRRRLSFSTNHRQDPAIAALATAATIMVVLAILAFLAPRLPGETATAPTRAIAMEGASDPPDLPSSGPARPLQLDFGGGLVQESPGQGAAAVGSDETFVAMQPGWLARIARSLLPILMLLLVFFAFRSVRHRASGRQLRVSVLPPLVPGDAELGLEASLDAILTGGGEPGDRITAAYHRLLLALAAAGVPRLTHEAPHEHLRRTLHPLGVQPAPMHRLAALYVAAQFGARALTDADITAATRALEDSLAGLRSANRLPAPGHAAA